MRHLIFFFALALPLIGTAQRLHQNKELSQEERITLHVKKMQLALDLTEEQSRLLTEIFKKINAPNLKKKQDISSEEHYQMRLKHLDHKIAIQNEVKTVLNEEQFTAWKKMQHSKKRRMAHQGKQSKSHHKHMHSRGREEASKANKKQF
jgi:methionyl-tRNA formyltransferase